MRDLKASRPSQKVFVVSVGVVGLVMLISSLVLVSPVHSVGTSVALNYSVNGLTCSLPGGTPTSVELLVQRVVLSPQFISKTGGLPYVYLGFDNTTDHVITTGKVTTTAPSPGNATSGVNIVGGVTTTRLPDTTELGFATWGPATSCASSGAYFHWINVQVPIQEGKYNITGAQVFQGGLA